MSFMEMWSSSNNIFAKLSYATLNDLFIGVQAVSFGAFARPEWENPITGANFGNLDGTPNYTQTDAIPGLATSVFPGGCSVKGLAPLKKLNAAQFSKMFKGNLSKLKPAQRGALNRSINKGVDKVNNEIGSGGVVIDAAVNGKTVVTDKSEND